MSRWSLLRTNDENVETLTSFHQSRVEESCLRLLESATKDGFHSEILSCQYLHRDATVLFLRNGLRQLSSTYGCLDSSRPWLTYWIIHSLELLKESLSEAEKDSVCQFLSKCQNPKGGFGGGPSQLSHLAPTYAATMTLCIIGRHQIINRRGLYDWMTSLRVEDGSFLMHEDGEVDIRGVYCALAVAKITNIYTPSLFHKTAEWIVQCQTYEGGFGGVPNMEAHGGYSYCGLASLLLLQKETQCNLESLFRWVSRRQMRLEGGFQGRTNKLVDGCYSFWQGGILPLLHAAFSKHTLWSRYVSDERWMFDTEALQEYILICCSFVKGGFVDKPGKNRDFYHTCYVLSGLSLAQHLPYGPSKTLKNNLVEETDILFNISPESLSNVSAYFQRLYIPNS